MFEVIRCDIRRFARTTRPVGARAFLRLLVYNFGMQAVLLYRFGRWLRRGTEGPAGWIRLPLFPVYWLLRVCIRAAYDIRLELSADIGPGLHIWHFGAIHVSRCRLGSHCTLHQRVRILPATDGSGPQIGDRVWIGPHAQIVGDLHIGDGATIGAGAVVKRDMAARSLCMGDPARVILAVYDNNSIQSAPAAELAVAPAATPRSTDA